MENMVNNQREILVKQAKSLARQGYSIIPVHGNNLPDNPKKPATLWRKYQRRIATGAEIEAAFSRNVSAMGIVCGQVSGLIVIDFDDTGRYRKFCLHFPDLAKSYTVKTRRGFHLYFRTGKTVRSQQFSGGDIKGERSYVIAPPSKIGDFSYVVAIADPVRELPATEVDAVLNYLQVGGLLRTVPGGIVIGRSDADVVAMYGRLAGEIGRNNALYRCASVARAAGLSEGETVELLAREHALAVVAGRKKSESLAARWIEARRTIESAYSGGISLPRMAGGIPNSVRECLLRLQRSSVVARLLDILRLAGWRPGAWFALSEAVEVASTYGLKRKAVLQALVGKLSLHGGREIIKRRYVEYLDSGILNWNRSGRPVEKVFQVPASIDLVSLFNVAWSPSDVIEAEDLRTAHSYRVALHREYIKRVAPRVPMSWLARRLGVAARSIQRYNRELKVEVCEHIGEMRLSHEVLKSLPQRRRGEVKNATPGFWLELRDGRRLPAWRHLGSRLLQEKVADARLCMRGTSQYRLAGGRAAVTVQPMSAAMFLRARAWRIAASGVVDGVRKLLELAKERASAVVYGNLPLFFESVSKRVAKDKVAETIAAYLYAFDGEGTEVRRPARRGIAYRMLKEFGDGNVFLALLNTGAETMHALARHLAGMGRFVNAMDLLSRGLG